MGVFSGTCPVPENAGDIDSTGTAYKYLKWISIGSTCIAAVLLISLKWAHLCNYRNPREQRHIIRISFAPLMWAAISMSGILHYKAAEYLIPVGDLIETIYLCAVFLLFLQYVVPGGDFGDEMFQLITEADEGGKKPAPVGWPRLTWLMVFQCPIFGLVVFLLTEITQALNDFCRGSLSPKYGNLWAQVISTISLGAAILAVVKFYGRTKSRINARRGLLKLIVLKSIWIFNILLEHNVIKPSATFSYSDLLYGVPNTLLCVEMVLFALAFWYACNPSEYSAKNSSSSSPRMPVYKAVFDAMNPKELFSGIGHVFSLIPEALAQRQSAGQRFMPSAGPGGRHKYSGSSGSDNGAGMYGTEMDSRYYGGSNGQYERLQGLGSGDGYNSDNHSGSAVHLPPPREGPVPAPAYRPYDS